MTSEPDNIGNKLYQLVTMARSSLFEQGELAQLTYSAFDTAVRSLGQSDEEIIEFAYPIALRADNPIGRTRFYKKDELLSRYQFLTFNQLAVNGIVQLATIIEALLGDVVRLVVLKYPHKLGSKSKIPMEIVLQATSIDDIHLRATDILLNELSYKSPREFAEEFEELLSVKLLDCPAFHRYIEIKATRDIWIHNQGIANDTYIRKAGTHVRVRSGMSLQVHIPYFLESYEVCLELIEWLEKELHDRWYSSDREDAKKSRVELQSHPPMPQSLAQSVEREPPQPPSLQSGAVDTPGQE